MLCQVLAAKTRKIVIVNDDHHHYIIIVNDDHHHIYVIMTNATFNQVDSLTQVPEEVILNSFYHFVKLSFSDVFLH